MSQERDDDKDPRPPMHWGDMGALVLAGGFSLFGLYLIASMLLGGHPLAVLFRKAPDETPRPLSQAEWNEKKFATQPGEIVISTGTVRVPGGSFPAIGDLKSLRITLSRSICLGTCPIYSVQISGDGSVVYHGQDCVAQKGERTAQISAPDVERLVQMFRDIDYFSLRDSYSAQVTDHPSYRTSIAFDGRSKSVSDYVGADVGMPASVSALEDAIDKAAGTGRWVNGGTRTCGGHAVK